MNTGRTPNINPNERKVLRALYAIYSEYDGFCFLKFRSLSRRTKLNRAEVRRSARSLKRKGLAEFGRGLWTEDGEVAGSGYACTKLGATVLAIRT